MRFRRLCGTLVNEPPPPPFRRYLPKKKTRLAAGFLWQALGAYTMIKPESPDKVELERVCGADRAYVAACPRKKTPPCGGVSS
jgi:hypothetical protein